MRSQLLFGILALSVLTANAAPMPVLPDLPPLPENYVPANDFGGFYAGALAGPAVTTKGTPALTLLAGYTFQATGYLFGGELAATFSPSDTRVEGDLRAGFLVNGSFAIFGDLGLGYSVVKDTYVAIGASADVDLGDSWLLRAQYKHLMDLSGQPATNVVQTGLLRKF